MELFTYDSSCELQVQNVAQLELFEYDNSLEVKYVDPEDLVYIAGRVDISKVDEALVG